MGTSQQALVNLRTELKSAAIVDSLAIMATRFPGRIVFSTSFGLEDQVVAHFIFANKLPIEVFTLDTGRLFPETYSTWSRTLEIYQTPIKAYYPPAEALQDWVSSKGPNAFYESVDNRKTCCHIRKVIPLRQALAGQEAWVTGIRADQSANRQQMDFIEWDEVFQLIKYHPLFDWSYEDTLHFARQNGIPYNPLHDKGFVSIGCAPCTRAVGAGEDFRAGRWWWEDQSKKECGLHAPSSAH